MLQVAADSLTARLGDDLAEITSSGGNTWSASFPDPPTGNQVTVADLVVPADTLIVFVGARELDGNRAGVGGPGGFSASGSSAFQDTVAARGESGALGGSPTDFGPWGGSIAFDSDTDWHFGATTSGLEFGETDFLTTALHEMGHVLGIGTAPAWSELVVEGEFTGAATVAEHDAGGNVPLGPSSAHWIAGTTEGGELALMVPGTEIGSRTGFGALDFAAFDDIGWDLLPAPPLTPPAPFDIVGDRTRMIYDGLDRLTSIVDSVGNQAVRQYDPAGRVIRRMSFGPVGGASPLADGKAALDAPVSSVGVIQSSNLVTNNLLSATGFLLDELGRTFQVDDVLFVNTISTLRTPDVADGATGRGHQGR